MTAKAICIKDYCDCRERDRERERFYMFISIYTFEQNNTFLGIPSTKQFEFHHENNHSIKKTII